MGSHLRISTRPDALPIGPVGDPLCVRAFTEALPDPQDPHCPFGRHPRLILTAAWLHQRADAAAAPTLPDLLARVAAGLTPEAFWASSRTQFLHYAGFELAPLDPDELERAIEECIGASARRISELGRLSAPSKGEPGRPTRKKAVRRSVKTALVS